MISVITPTHDTRWLKDAFDSLVAQTYADWQWVIVPNNGAVVPEWGDDRILVVPYESNSVGALKYFGFMAASGEWLVELDHDDMLAPTALEAIASSAADFVYSNSNLVNLETGKPYTYASGSGWEYRGTEAVSPLPYPSNFSRIWFAPDHVRAWRRSFYHDLGGHDTSMRVADDHDLVCRSYLEGSVQRIDEPLYTYRVHGDNTWLQRNAEIQAAQWANHDRYFLPLAQKWSALNDLRVIDIGGALDSPGGYETYDRHNADIVGNLNDTWDLVTNSVGLLRAHDVIEHLIDPIHTMNEAWRVLAHGGVLDIMVPSTRGEGAFCDPTHVSFWNKRSFRYYTDPKIRRYVEPECVAQFMPVRVRDMELWDEKLPYVQAQLVAIKDGPRIHGPQDWQED